MEPQTRFCTTTEGTRVAYSSRGDGSPLVMTPFSWDRMNFSVESARGIFANRLAERHMLVRYDRSGSGLSDRDRQDFTVDADVRDLAAVVDHLELQQFSLFGSFHLGPAAIVYAARNPDRVSRLILYGTFANGRELARDEIKTSLISMVRSHWGMASRLLVDVVAPGIEGVFADELARDLRESVTGETVARLIEMSYSTDVREVLGDVVAPTLVLHRRGDRAVPFRMARELGAFLPNSRLVALDGNIHYPWYGDTDSVLRAIEEFLGTGRRPEHETTASPHRPLDGHATGTAVILFADIADSTALTERLGDAAFRDRARKLDGSLREMIRAQQGTPVEGKLLGDGVLAVFMSARQAVQAALRCREAGAECELELHLGIHAGDVIREGDNVFGGAVNLAARVAGASAPGEVLVSQTVRDLARTSAGVQFDDRGEHALKGIAEPQRLFAVQERE